MSEWTLSGKGLVREAGLTMEPTLQTIPYDSVWRRRNASFKDTEWIRVEGFGRAPEGWVVRWESAQPSRPGKGAMTPGALLARFKRERGSFERAS
jgi:hypothetical protein